MLKHIRDVGAESAYNGGRCQLVNLPAPSTIFRSYPSEIRFAPHWHEFHPSTIFRTYGAGGTGSGHGFIMIFLRLVNFFQQFREYVFPASSVMGDVATPVK